MKTLAIIALLASCAPAFAQLQCGNTAALHNELRSRYGEEPIFLGQQADGTVIEVWGGEESWTAFVTRPDGTSCLLTDGVGYERPRMGANL